MEGNWGLLRICGFARVLEVIEAALVVEKEVELECQFRYSSVRKVSCKIDDNCAKLTGTVLEIIQNLF